MILCSIILSTSAFIPLPHEEFHIFFFWLMQTLCRKGRTRRGWQGCSEGTRTSSCRRFAGTSPAEGCVAAPLWKGYILLLCFSRPCVKSIVMLCGGDAVLLLRFVLFCVRDPSVLSVSCAPRTASGATVRWRILRRTCFGKAYGCGWEAGAGGAVVVVVHGGVVVREVGMSGFIQPLEPEVLLEEPEKLLNPPGQLLIPLAEPHGTPACSRSTCCLLNSYLWRQALARSCMMLNGRPCSLPPRL